MSRPCDNRSLLSMDERQLATVFAALRFHQAENLQIAGGIPDHVIRDIATDGGILLALDSSEVDNLCQLLNTTIETTEAF